MLNQKSMKLLIDSIYDLIRRSCKIEKIFILEMPNSRNNFKINYILMKNQRNKFEPDL